MKQLVTAAFSIAFSTNLYAQVTAVPFLQIPPDARHSAMGNIGAATYADASANFHNPAKLAFTDRLVGGNITRFSWLKNLVDDMHITNVSAYFKPKSGNQAIGLYYTAFDQGRINFSTATGQPDGSFSSLDQAVGLTYAKKLAKNISLGMGLKYIHSKFSGTSILSNNLLGQTVAGDIGLFGQAGKKESFKFNYGLALSNIGGKMSYERNAYNLPTNIRAGIAPTFQKNKSRFLIGFDIIKDIYGKPFNDIDYAIGGEYSYNNYVFGRIGYFKDPAGGRKYLTLGVGGKIMKQFGLDFAYRIAEKSSPFYNTAQLSLVVDFKSTNKDVIKTL